MDDDGDQSGAHNFSSINQAITYADPGDIIYVYDGEYYETVVFDTAENITLIGNGSATTIINKLGQGDGIRIERQGINISGLTIKNGGRQTYPDYDVGIEISHKNCYLHDIIIKEFYYAGMRLSGAQNATIENVTIKYIERNGILVGPSKSGRGSDGLILRDSLLSGIDGNGMYIRSSTVVTIDHSSFSHNFEGITVVDTERLVLRDSTFSDSLHHGVKIDDSDTITILNTSVVRNLVGIELVDSTNYTLIGNEITEHGYGVYLKNAHNGMTNSEIRKQNYFDGNDADIYVYKEYSFRPDRGTLAFMIILYLAGGWFIYSVISNPGRITKPILKPKKDQHQPQPERFRSFADIAEKQKISTAQSQLTTLSSSEPNLNVISTSESDITNIPFQSSDHTTIQYSTPESTTPPYILRNQHVFSTINYLLLLSPILVIGQYEEWEGLFFLGFCLSIPIFLATESAVLRLMHFQLPSMNTKNTRAIIIGYMAYSLIFLTIMNELHDAGGPSGDTSIISALITFSCCGFIIGTLVYTVFYLKKAKKLLQKVEHKSRRLKIELLIFGGLKLLEVFLVFLLFLSI